MFRYQKYYLHVYNFWRLTLDEYMYIYTIPVYVCSQFKTNEFEERT